MRLRFSYNLHQSSRAIFFRRRSGNVLIWWDFVCSDMTSIVIEGLSLGSQFTDELSLFVCSICRLRLLLSYAIFFR